MIVPILIDSKETEMKEINGLERTVKFEAEVSAEIIVFRNDVQVALWDNEITGQLSDGMWENTRPLDHWKVWCRATAVAGDPDMKLGRNFWAQKDNYNLNSANMIDWLGDRMIKDVERDTGISLTIKGLRAELADMKKIIRIQNR